MKVFLFTTVLFSGLIAGLFYAYSCSVNAGLKSLSDIEYVKAMQSINIAIQNPVFFISFMGLLVLFPITAYQQYGQQANSYYLLISAMIIYFTCVFAITIFGNVPLNEQLAKFPTPTAAGDQITAMRHAFEKPWNYLHTIRTVSAIISFSLIILFILKQKN